MTIEIISKFRLAVHFEQLTGQFDGVPLIVTYGKPISGKSSAVEPAMTLIGQFDRVGGEINLCLFDFSL
jgi:hypothetical protein